MLNGTPNEFTTFNGIAVPVKDQVLWDNLGLRPARFGFSAAPWAWRGAAPFKWMSSCVAPRRTAEGTHVVARPHRRRGRYRRGSTTSSICSTI